MAAAGISEGRTVSKHPHLAKETPVNYGFQLMPNQTQKENNGPGELLRPNRNLTGVLFPEADGTAKIQEVIMADSDDLPNMDPKGVTVEEGWRLKGGGRCITNT